MDHQTRLNERGSMIEFKWWLNYWSHRREERVCLLIYTLLHSKNSRACNNNMCRWRKDRKAAEFPPPFCRELRKEFRDLVITSKSTRESLSLSVFSRGKTNEFQAESTREKQDIPVSSRIISPVRLGHQSRATGSWQCISTWRSETLTHSLTLLSQDQTQL